MFGLEKKASENTGKKNEFIFDLEKAVKNPQEKRKLQQKVETRIQAIKQSLRSGEDQEAFSRLGVFLHGYNALLKVINRVKN